MLSKIKEDIYCVFDRDPASRTVFEILTTYPGTHALLMHRWSHWLWSRQLKWLARSFSYVGRWFTGIEIHPGATIGRRFFIDHGTGVVIGETAEIGDDVTLYHGVTLGGTTWNKGKRHPTIGNNVVVGAGAKILGPITVGEDARIGSNAVVLKNVKPGATMVGIPAREAGRVSNTIDEQRRETASKIGFDAYGVTTDMPDPMVEAVNKLLDHIHRTDRQFEQMRCALRKLGEHVDSAEPLELDDWMEQCKQECSESSTNDCGEKPIAVEGIS
ncbi:serine O-acetyltransferase [Chromatiales bacterium (ex Bugula neritina AB1)]|nr:serine O-acetyltransferase [Chromatiales bacterium (ex Bugula neritina AB1)]